MSAFQYENIKKCKIFQTSSSGRPASFICVRPSFAKALSFLYSFLRIKMLKVQVHAFWSLCFSRMTHKDLKTRQLLESIRNCSCPQRGDYYQPLLPISSAEWKLRPDGDLGAACVSVSAWFMCSAPRGANSFQHAPQKQSE